MSEALAAWDGYAYDVPSGPRAEARSRDEIHLHRLLYARVLSQIGRRSATGEPELEAQAWASGLGPWILGTGRSRVVGGPAWIRTSIKSSWLPIEVIIGRYAALVESALDAGQPDEARRLLMLLKSLGGEVP